MHTPLSLSPRVAAVVTALLATTCAFAQPAPAPDAGRVVEIEVPAPSLEGNLLGSATTQSALVYLPPSYELAASRRYPVVYLLHGIFDNYRGFVDNFGVDGILDRAIAAGEVPETIVVMPHGANRYGGGFYRDSPVAGGWASFVVDDLVGHVDAGFRTLARPGGRAVVGHSMGGYGALHLAMSRPGVFSTVWAMSPCCLAAADDFGFGNEAWRQAARFSAPEEIGQALASGGFYAVAAIGVLTAFAPDPDSPPFYVDFPFDLVRGEVVLDDEEYDRYLDQLPLRRVSSARRELRELRGLAIGVGLGDQFLHIPVGSLALSRRLGEERIPHLLDLYDGDHRQLVSERLERVVLPWVSERLDAPE